MANDPSMPPSEQAATTPTDNSPAMSADMAGAPAPAGGQDGSVMINMPKAAFDAIHALVTQLSQGLDQLKQGVDSQAQGGAASAPAAAPTAPEPPAAGGKGEMSDDDFLKGLAEEGNKR